MNRVELTNMVMVYDPQHRRVVVQQRVKSWKGIAFPGGHVDPNEGFMASAAREVQEETGLAVENLQPCGLIHWCQNKTNDRYLVFLYKTQTYTGELLKETEEGKVWWEPLETLSQRTLSPNFERYLPLFLQDGFQELFLSWNKKAEDPPILYSGSAAQGGNE